MNCYFDKKVNINEAICLMETKINEIIDAYNRVDKDHAIIAEKIKELEKLVDYLLGAGLEAEVIKKLNEWLADGTLANIIGDVLVDIETRVAAMEKQVNISNYRYAKMSSSLQAQSYSFWSNTRNQVDSGFFSLSMITDTHWNDAELRPKSYNSKYEIKAWNNCVSRQKLNDTVVLGDLINGDYKNEVLLNDVNTLMPQIEKSLVIHGNHDNGSYIENLQIKDPDQYGKRGNSALGNRDMFEFYYKENKITALDKDTLAFYKDYENEKVRLVHINTNDLPMTRETADGRLEYNPISSYGISPKQIKWLVENAFNFTAKPQSGAGWRIVIISHCPLEPSLFGSGYSAEYPFYYNLSGTVRNEIVANQGFIRQIIRKLNAGTGGEVKGYLWDVPTGTHGSYKRMEKGGPVDTPMTAEIHKRNRKYFASKFTVGGSENEEFAINMSQSVMIPVIGCFSGHIHADNSYLLDNNTFHVTLSGLANSGETQTGVITENDYAMTTVVFKDNKFMLYRQGRGKGAVSDTIFGGTTNYGIQKFANIGFTYK